jgi:hypothetical protein
MTDLSGFGVNQAPENSQPILFVLTLETEFAAGPSKFQEGAV